VSCGAAQAGHAEIVRVLLDAKANPNARKKNGVTPLVGASFGGHVEVVGVLLKSGADPNRLWKMGRQRVSAISCYIFAHGGKQTARANAQQEQGKSKAEEEEVGGKI
jgi:ankyrin repeat protein